MHFDEIKSILPVSRNIYDRVVKTILKRNRGGISPKIEPRIEKIIIHTKNWYTFEIEYYRTKENRAFEIYLIGRK